MDDAAIEDVAQGHWECPNCRALVPATDTLAAGSRQPDHRHVLRPV
jgi:hypothetical protein